MGKHISQLIFISIWLPLIWSLAACSTASRSDAGVHEPVTTPVAVLGTPKKSVEIYRMTTAEHPDSTYVVVRVDKRGSRTYYGDETTVGSVLETLNDDLKYSTTVGTRCPAASGWHYEMGNLRVNYCTKNQDTRRIERAVSFLETSL